MPNLIADCDPFLGVDGGGNVLPGPCLPHGLVRLGPDIVPPMGWTAHGYRSGEPIQHFSHTHVSGTGGGGRYGNVGVLPFIGRLTHVVPPVRLANEHASPGWYSCTLAPDDIAVECTATAQVGLHRWRFPAGSEANLLLRAGAVIQTDQAPSLRPGDDGTGCSIGGLIEMAGPRALAGRADLRGGWGHAQPYSIFFWLEWSHSATSLRLGDAQGCLPLDPAFPGHSTSGPGLLCALGFGAIAELELRVGISLVSIAKARAAVQACTDQDFTSIAASARATWERQFAGIRVEGGTAEHRTLLASSLLRLATMPTDLGIDDEHPYLHTGRRAFTDHYCIWDSVRGADSLRCLLHPDLHRDILNDMLATGQQRGWLADADIVGHPAFLQGACGAHTLFADAACRGLDGVDYAAALEMMRHDAERASPDPYRFGRYPVDAAGAVPIGVRNAVSRTIEYAAQDAAIASVATHCGQGEVATRYRQRAAGLWRLWRDDLGCFAPRHAHGAWVQPFDPVRMAHDQCWMDPWFYEANARMWTLALLHDLPELVRRLGGPAGFATVLDRFFDPATGENLRWKEMILHTPWLYHQAGQPARCAAVLEQLLSKHYGARRNGLPDNEDMGAQSTFLVGALVGLYPQVGSDRWWLSRPRFARVELDLAGGRTLALVPGTGPAGSATLNGKALTEGQVGHAQLLAGGELAVS